MQSTDGQEPIAIVGAGCRFPGGVGSPGDFWRFIAEGRSAIGPVPADRWDPAALPTGGAAGAGSTHCSHGGFLDDVTGFDADFFGIAPREARQMDPQQRLLLEVCWESLAHAGIPPSSLEGTRTSVHSGAISNDYLLMHNRQAGLGDIDPWYATGKEFSFGPGRIAYLLGTAGPAFALNAACASSLVGVHLACLGLRAGDTDLGLVAASSLLLSPELTLFMSQVGALAPDGRCKVFDASADGTVRSEGAACVVLKRLSDALADRDRVLAVIRGSAVNHNGRSAGLTVPSGAAQRALIEEAVGRAGVSPGDIDYLEAHGTGTALGDPVEMGAAAAALSAVGERTDPLLVGSVKTNLGHTDTVAGLAGLLKAALVLDSGNVSPHLHLDRPHPGIRWDNWPVEVPTELTPLSTRCGRPHLAGVSAFGLSGTNAHVVLEQAPQRPAPREQSERSQWRILPLSARRPRALAELAERHSAALGELETPTELTDYTQTAGRFAEHHQDHRACVAGRDADELRERLAELGPELAEGEAERPRSGGVVFVCSGQGRQWPGMARALRAEPVFDAALRDVDELVQQRAGWSVLGELAATAPRFGTDTEYTQPVVFALQVALAAQWESWGIRPDAVIGHSMGEIAAAYLGGALTLSEAVDVVVARGRLLGESSGGGRMLAAEMPLTAARELCTDEVGIAAVNAEEFLVFSGTPAAVERVRERLVADGVRVRAMPGEYAFHSPAMARYSAPLAEAVAHLRPRPPRIPVVTTTRPGAPVEQFGPDYWAANVVEPVSFGAGMGELVEQGHRVFVELGPHPVLRRPIVACLGDVEGVVTGSLRADTDAYATMLGGLGELYAAGLDVTWPNVGVETGERAVLPSYPWQREHFWFSASEGAPQVPEAPAAVPPRVPAPRTGEAPAPRTGEAPRGTPRVAADAETLVAEAVGTVLGLPPKRVRRGQGFAEMGMDSITAVELAGLLSERFARPLNATLTFDYPTVRALAEYLGSPPPPATAAPAPEPASAPAREPARVGDERRQPPTGGDAVAVVGMGCRLPGGVFGPDDLWRLLTEKADAVGDAPEGRFAEGGVYPGGYLDDVLGFDARFFRISPREARVMDPQQRLFLEVAWEALEDAGVTAPALEGSQTGIFVGMNSHDHAAMASADQDAVDSYYGTGNSFSGSAGRLSYFLGAHGPNLAVDTACSSSLVGVHLAVQSLRTGESDLALAGGVNIILRPTIHRSSEALGALSPEGRCKSFDESADGYVRGEGCGAVVLKRLSDAVADGDRVHAVLLGTAVNSDGASSGLTVPNGLAQQRVIRSALSDAAVDPARIGYVEAHGTGTALGDPIELRALGAVLDTPERRENCLVGSVKANIGHLEAASGVVGLITSVLVVDRARALPHPHFTHPSSKIPWDELPLTVPLTPSELDRNGPRLAGVSSFGFTGTNAHVVLSSAEPPEPPAADGTAASSRTAPTLALPVSAPTRSGVAEQARVLRDELVDHPEVSAVDVCFTAARHRTQFEHRAVAVGADRDELVGALDAIAVGSPPEHGIEVAGTADTDQAGQDDTVALVCSGHGGYWPGVGADLYAAEEVFAASVDRCSDAMQPYLGWSPAERVAAGKAMEVEEEQQALVFVLQVALADLWSARGVRPAAVVGHSMGEVAAAHIAGALDLDSAARLMALRCRQIGKLMGKGGMALIGLEAEQTESEIADVGDRLWVSVVNSSASTVVSGYPDAIETVLRRLRARNVFCRPISSGAAGHCPVADDLAADLVGELDWLRPARPDIPFYSAVTGSREDRLDARYWGRNIRDRVRFDLAVRALADDGVSTFVELSAHPLLSTSIEQELAAVGAEGVVVGSLSKDGPERTELSVNAARLHVRGRAVDLGASLPEARRVGLPRYAWEHRTYQLETTAPAAPDRRADSARLLDSCVEFDGAWLAQSTVDAALLAAVGATGDGAAGDGADVACLPSVLLAAALACGQRRHPAAGLTLRDVRLMAPLVVGRSETHHARIALRAAASGASASDGEAELVMRSTAADGERPPRTRMTALLSAGGDLRGARHAPAPDESSGDNDASEGAPEMPDGVSGLPAGLRFLRLRREADDLLLDIEAEHRTGPRGPHHPVAACFWAAEFAARHRGEGAAREVSAVDSITVAPRFDDPEAAAWTLRVSGTAPRDGAADVTLHDEGGRCLVRADGIRLSRTSSVVLDPAEQRRLGEVVYRDVWREAPPVETSPSTSANSASGSWLIVGDPDGIGSAVQDRLQQQGTEAELLATVDGLGRVVAERLRGTGLGTVLHLGALADPEPGQAASAVAAVPELAGALAATAARTGPRCHYVTRGAYGQGRGSVSWAQRAVWTTARRCAIEYPRSWGGLLDLDPVERDRWVLADQILGQVLAADGEDHVCLRGGTRFLRRIVAEPQPPAVRTPEALEAEATYLVAEAGPGVDAAVAGWLADRGARNITLCGAGQQPLPDTCLDELRARGAEVRCERTDLTDAHAVQFLDERCAAEGRPVRGAVWAGADWRLREDGENAGRSDEAPPGAAGAWNLHERCARLDLFVVFSTAASCWGARDIGEQAAEDGKLRALVDHRLLRGMPATGVAWAPWDVPQLLDAHTTRSLGRIGVRPLAVDEAVGILDHLVATDTPTAIVVDADRPLLVDMYAQAGPWPLFAELAEAPERQPGADGAVERLARMSSEQRVHHLLSMVREELAVVLGMEEPEDIEADWGFFALGLNSVGALELRVRLQRGVGTELPSTVAFDHPTPAALAAALETHLDIAQPDTAPGPEPSRGAPETSDAPEDPLARFEREMAAAEAVARKES
ncbi:type I polyketide synthase [Streptomyces sulphureus]|uniref:type I polyketide synthase n=1 Tax=Streptomyces sulphureus TaxID=47758 RepID=UPI0003779A7D|nr:type I polyketide synthase [Streptomyces sulphureus]